MKRKYSLNEKLNIASICLLVISLIVLIPTTYSWFMNSRKLNTIAWIKAPIILKIGSGNDHDIVYLDMGNIDTSHGHSVDYVFCVYGEPVDIYSLQLAHTTNIAFYYDVYRAKIADASAEETVTFSYLENNVRRTEYFVKSDTSLYPVISALPIYLLSESEISQHQSHHLSYGDEKGQNPIASSFVQSNAEPLYWLAREGGVNIMNPDTEYVGSHEDGSTYFCDYYILHISWEEGQVTNDKETDIIYLTASR